MIRAYTLRLEDFTEDSSVRYVEILSITDAKLFYQGSEVNSVIIPSENLEDSYIQIESTKEHKCSVEFRLSYDSILMSEKGVIEFVFKEYVFSDTCSDDLCILDYISHNPEIDYKSILSRLYTSKLMPADDYTIIVPILSFNAIPLNLRDRLSTLSIEDASYTCEVILEDSNDVLLNLKDVGNIDTSIIDNVYVVFPTKESYNGNIVLTIKDSKLHTEQLVLKDINKDGKSYYDYSIEEYNKLLEDE